MPESRDHNPAVEVLIVGEREGDADCEDERLRREGLDPPPGAEHEPFLEEHVCGLAVDGSVYGWGRNDVGQVGDGTLIDRPVPNPVRLMTGL